MDDLLLMSVVDGVADRAKQLQALGNGQLPIVAVLVQGLAAFDELHDKVRQSIVSRAAIQKPRNVRMVQGGENLSLFAKASQNKISVHPALDELNRYTSRELFVYAHGLVNRTHAAAADLAHNFIRAEPFSD